METKIKELRCMIRKELETTLDRALELTMRGKAHEAAAHLAVAQGYRISLSHITALFGDRPSNQDQDPPA